MPRIPIQSLANGVVLQPVPISGQSPLAAVSTTSVTVVAHDTATQLTVYAAETGGTVISQPLSTGAGGVIPGWLDAATVATSGADAQIEGQTYVLAPPTPLPLSVVSDSRGVNQGDGLAFNGSAFISAEAPLNLQAFGAALNGTTDDSAAIAAAYAAFTTDLDGNSRGEILIPGPCKLNNWTPANSDYLKLTGIAGKTWLVEGASGRVMTIPVGRQFKMEDINWGDQNGASTVNRAYSTPLVELQTASQRFTVENCHPRLSGTGLLFHLNAAFNGSFKDSLFDGGQYGLPIMYDDVVAATDADTIAFRDLTVLGNFGVIIRHPSNGFSTPLFDQFKLVSSFAETIIEDALDYTAGFGEVAAGATQIQVSNSGWTSGRSIFIEGDYATDNPSGRSGSTAEVNKVTAVSGTGPYVLTLAQPLQYNHGTNAGTFVVQVLGGGMGVSLSSNMWVGSIESSHFEDVAFAVIAAGIAGLRMNGTTNACDRLLRVTGGCTDIEIGLTDMSGRNSNVVLLDYPALNVAATLCDRFYLVGPWRKNSPTVLDSGTSYTMDLIHNGANMRSKHYVAWDNVAGTPRLSRHAGTAGPVAMRFGYSTNPDQTDIFYGSGISTASNFSSTGGQTRHRNAQAGNYTVNTSDRIIACTGTATTAQTITLPAASSAGAGFLLTIKDETGGAGTHNITITPNGTDKIDGASSATISTNYGTLRMYSTGSAWATI